MSNPQRLPLNALRAFEAAARHGSINKASHELHVSRAAISMQISRLERRLGRALFERRHRQIESTPDGEALLHAVKTGFAIIERAFVQLARHPGAERLVIAADPDFASLWLVPRLADYYAAVPGVLVEIRAGRIRSPLEDPSVSCAIQYAEADCVIENAAVLFRSRLFPVCTRQLMETLPLKAPEDLRRQVLLHDRSFDEWKEYFARAGIEWPAAGGLGALFSDTALCLEAAARGQGVAMGDDFLASSFLSEGRLVKPFGPDLLSKHAYYFFQPEDVPVSSAVSALRRWLLQSIEYIRDGSK